MTGQEHRFETLAAGGPLTNWLGRGALMNIFLCGPVLASHPLSTAHVFSCPFSTPLSFSFQPHLLPSCTMALCMCTAATSGTGSISLLSKNTCTASVSLAKGQERWDDPFRLPPTWLNHICWTGLHINYIGPRHHSKHAPAPSYTAPPPRHLFHFTRWHSS